MSRCGIGRYFFVSMFALIFATLTVHCAGQSFNERQIGGLRADGDLSAVSTNAGAEPGSAGVSPEVTEAAHTPKPPVTSNAQVPILSLGSSSLRFIEYVGSDPAAEGIKITNTGAANANWTASSDVSWLQLGATSGVMTGGTAYVLSVTPVISGLSPGTYKGTLTIHRS